MTFKTFRNTDGEVIAIDIEKIVTVAPKGDDHCIVTMTDGLKHTVPTSFDTLIMIIQDMSDDDSV